MPSTPATADVLVRLLEHHPAHVESYKDRIRAGQGVRVKGVQFSASDLFNALVAFGADVGDLNPGGTGSAAGPSAAGDASAPPPAAPPGPPPAVVLPHHLPPGADDVQDVGSDMEAEALSEGESAGGAAHDIADIDDEDEAPHPISTLC